MRVTGYNDELQANQYFEFHVILKPDSGDFELRGHAQVVVNGTTNLRFKSQNHSQS